MSVILKVENLSHKDILNNVSFEIKKNSFNVIIGPNSCGKTTLIKCLGGLLNYNGSVFFNNKMISSNENDIHIRKDIGIVIDLFDVLGQNNCETVMDNLMYPLLNLDYSERDAKRRVYSLSEKLDFGFMLMKSIKELKNSDKKFLCFVKAIVHDPSIIIIDDIFDSLNDFYKDKIFNYLKKMKKTIIFITSNEEYILYTIEDKVDIIADKTNEQLNSVIIMNKGKIIEQSSLVNIIKDEKKFVRNGFRLPCIVELSHKLQAYDLLKDITLKIDEMVNEIWE